MKNILILIIIFSYFFASCFGKQDSVSSINIMDFGTVDNKYLELIDSSGVSFLQVDGRKIIGLKLKTPCYFVKRNGEIQYFSYPDVGVNIAIIIAGKTDGASMSTHPSCGNATQGLILKKDTVLFNNKIVDENYTCPNQSLDEKEFWSVAHL